MKRTRFCILLFFTLLISNCSKFGNTKGNYVLSGITSGFTYPLCNLLLNSYLNENESAKTNHLRMNTEAGIHSFLNKTVDFSCTIILDPINLNSEQKADILHIPCAKGAIVFAYNLEGVENLNLDAKTIIDIYAEKIKFWNDPAIQILNPDVELKEIPITTIHYSHAEEASNAIRNYLNQINSEITQSDYINKNIVYKNGLGVKGEDNMAYTIRNNSGAIGYLDAEKASLTHLSTAAIRNSSGNFIKATKESIAKASPEELPLDMRVNITNSPHPEAYPISTYCWILVYKNNEEHCEKQKKLVTLLNHIIAPETQNMIKIMNYAPLSKQEIERAENLINKIGCQEKAMSER